MVVNNYETIRYIITNTVEDIIKTGLTTKEIILGNENSHSFRYGVDALKGVFGLDYPNYVNYNNFTTTGLIAVNNYPQQHSCNFYRLNFINNLPVFSYFNYIDTSNMEVLNTNDLKNITTNEDGSIILFFARKDSKNRKMYYLIAEK